MNPSLWLAVVVGALIGAIPLGLVLLATSPRFDAWVDRRIAREVERALAGCFDFDDPPPAARAVLTPDCPTLDHAFTDDGEQFAEQVEQWLAGGAK